MDHDKNDKSAASSLKKILSSGGTVKGAFYFAADGKLKEAGILIYLAAKAAKANSEGKKLRKSIPSARFARGVVDVHNNRPLFVIHGGNASPALVKKACKNVLSKRDGLRFLSRALAKMSEDEGVEEDELNENEGERAAIDQSLQLSPEEEAELKALTEELDTEQVSQDVEQLFKSFTSADTSSQELAELNRERLQDVTAKEEALGALEKPSDAWTKAYAELREARFALAETNYAGPDPFPGVDEPLEGAAAAVLSAAVEGTMRFLATELSRLQAELTALEASLASGQVSETEIRDRRTLLTTTSGAYDRQLIALQGELG